MGTLWVVTAPAPPKWRLDPVSFETVLKQALPTVDVGLAAGPVPALVWTDTRGGQWVEGRLAIIEPDSVAFKGWPELIVDHALVVSRLLPNESAVVLTNDQGDIYDLRQLSDRDALLMAINRTADG